MAADPNDRTVRREWRAVRVKDISGGFVADADWEALQDVPGWKADSQPHWYAPNPTGILELRVQLYDDASTPVPALSNSRVDIQAIELARSPDVAPQLIDVGGERQIPIGALVTDPQSPIPIQSEIGMRVYAAQNLPAANFLAVMARMG